ncbi:murein biosynthesis integral membrane protein MurJ [Sporosarcina aquimarina]|uniref:Murein biosynthesis integral membrane protein MurJ n=1 Tax=Sporosarcina aquimarina TaxID=114975 RepID=A0ABU4FX34_9BACL|nr:murein biosynthesis integral membrane protein MurJ [Sporosarcina aquimarina]MDW0108692.1 murein biosynthesis integral membrane protein MurJ [Sporosarcina aquimarina]
MGKLKQAALWTAMLALVLKLSGLVRESIVGTKFGVSNETDAYFLSFAFITLVVAMISTGFNNVFLPMYIKNRKSGEAGDHNANALLNWTMIIFVGISFIGWFGAPYFLPLMYVKMKAETALIAIPMTQIFFAFMTVIALSGLLDSYLQSRRIFVPSQMSKLLATFFSVVFAILFSDQWGIFSLVYGFIFGTILGVIVQLYYLVRSDYKWRLEFKMDIKFRNAFLLLIVPSLLNSVVGQVNMFVNKAFASGTTEGAVTYLNNASLIVSIPNAIYATTLAAIIFTLMSEQTEERAKFKETFFRGMEISLVTLLPIAAGLLVIGDSVIAFIYEHGKFTPDDTHKTHIALMLYLPFIVFQGMQLMLSKSMYARGKTAVVFRISVTTILINFLSNWLLVDRFGYPALAIATSVVSIYFFAVSMVVVYKDLGKEELARFGKMVPQVVIPTVIMGAVVNAAKAFAGLGSFGPIVQLATLVPIGVVVYVVMLFVFYRAGFRRFVGLLKRG